MSRKLLVFNPDRYMEIPFDQQLTIGRDVYNALSLQDAEISRSHAIIFEQGERTIVKDLNSRNGVYVNGKKVEEMTIEPGTEIILGSTIIFFDPPDDLNIEQSLSRRGRRLMEKRAEQTGPGRGEVVTVFTAAQMDEAIHRLFHAPENTSFFSLANATELLSAFYEMGAAPDASELFRRALDHAMGVVGGHRGVIMESDFTKEKLKVRAIIAGEDNDSHIEISQQVLRVVLRAERAVYCLNVSDDNRFSKIAKLSRHPVHSFIASPVMSGKNYFGFIYFDSEDDSIEYDYVALRSLYLIASHLAALLQPRQTRFSHDPLADSRERLGISS